MICLLVIDGINIPDSRNKLYCETIRLLLSRWNEEKNIYQWNLGCDIYKLLDTEQKENLFSEIAYAQFKELKHFMFYEQSSLVDFIYRYLRTKSLSDAEDVLKSIELVNGILVETSFQRWSFAYYSFQDYFLSRYLKKISPYLIAQRLNNASWKDRVLSLLRTGELDIQFLKTIQVALWERMNIDISIFKNTILLPRKTGLSYLRFFFYLSLFAKSKARKDSEQFSQVFYKIKNILTLEEKSILRLDSLLFSLYELSHSKQNSIIAILVKIELLLESDWSGIISDASMKQIAFVHQNIQRIDTEKKIGLKDCQTWLENLKKIINVSNDFNLEIMSQLLENQWQPLSSYCNNMLLIFTIIEEAGLEDKEQMLDLVYF